MPTRTSVFRSGKPLDTNARQGAVLGAVVVTTVVVGATVDGAVVDGTVVVVVDAVVEVDAVVVVAARVVVVDTATVDVVVLEEPPVVTAAAMPPISPTATNGAPIFAHTGHRRRFAPPPLAVLVGAGCSAGDSCAGAV